MKHNKEREKIEAFYDNKLIVRKGFDPMDITSGINWDYQHDSNANTYQTYLHSLSIVNAMTIISKADGNEKLQENARDIIMDWHNTDHSKGNNFAWKEHPVSSRLNYIIDFQDFSENFKINDKDFNEIISDHCDFLYTERNYKFNNHGLMMDYSLLNASKYISDKTQKTMYTDKALYRIRYALRRDFTRRGIHLENSPEYHRMVLMIFRKIERKLKELRIPLGKQEKEILDLADQFKNIMIQPNQLYPIIGDTGTISDKRIIKNYNDFIDSEAGIAVIHNENKKDNEKSTMLTFKCGYQSKTHKHYDDLSSTLYIEGKELLVDSGKYSYNSKDPIRKHIISPKGHNTILIKGKNYKLSTPFQDQFGLRLLRLSKKRNYKLISGINKLYSNVNMTRHNILTEHNIYIVVDRIVSTELITSQQNFNFNEKAVVNKIDNHNFEIQLDDETYVLKTFERYDSTITSSIEKGYISRVFAEYNENKRVVFSQDSKNATFISVILNKNKLSSLGEINLLNSKLNFTIDDKKTTIDL